MAPLKAGLKLATSASKALTSVGKKFTKTSTKTTKVDPKVPPPKVTKKTVDPKEAAAKEAADKDAAAKGRAAMERALLTEPPKTKRPITTTTLTPVPNDINMRQKLVQEFTTEEFEYFEKTVVNSDFYEKPIIVRKIDEVELNEHDQYPGEVPCLREFEHTKVTDKLGNEFYILMVGAGETAICADDSIFIQTAVEIPATRTQPASTSIITKKRPTEESLISVGVKELAADMAMQTLEPKKVAKGWTEEPQFVQVAVIKNESKDALQNCEEFVTAIKNYENNRKSTGPKTIPDPTKKIKYVKFPATCHCNKPDVYSLKPATIKCTNCQTIAHAECINNATAYTCSPCQIKIEGVNWGQGHAPNSCPVDNTVTHFAVRASKNPNFLKSIDLLSKSDIK